MQWSKTYETGNVNVDGQHKEIFRLVQHVLDADAFSSRNEKIETAMGFLSEYAVRHFTSEEALMKESQYPDYDRHKAQHDNFVKEIINIVNRFKKEGDTTSINETINNFVVSWLKEHIMDSDKDLAEFYKKWKIAN